MNSVKPIVGVSNVQNLHPLYFKEFKENFLQLQHNKNDFRLLVVSGIFLYLSFESYLNWLARFLLEHVNSKDNAKVISIWNDFFQNKKYISDKLDFLKTVFLKDQTDFKVLQEFSESMKSLRNMLIHGSEEHSVTHWSNFRQDKSKFAKLLNFETIENSYKLFLKALDDIIKVVETIEMKQITKGYDKQTIVEEIKLTWGKDENLYGLVNDN